ncbi:site-specific DNA-methyltransferase [Hominifimenecus sp. rT4P-3]|uniref:site-specific DNA-methyltransferase n=1 Tax=Hominifimenecus sp. rT4P-3 TaxID=3242979 RepID=UPI003DA451E5
MANKLELTWYGKDKQIKIEPRLLIEDTALSNCASDPDTENMLIHGDNLLALKALESKYTGKVKCIYIDPPYNTGAAFDHYDDNLEHSTWLGLMYMRLQILKKLLADDGVFCCQIDDSEGAYLKVLLDEIFGRSNYLNTFYVQVRYPNKTLAEDSDYQKVIEQCHVYAKQRPLAKLNRPQVEYDISKFKWRVVEDAVGEVVTLGNKRVEIFKPGQYHIEEIEPCLEGLKETWATGSLARVKASAGEFFELYLVDRKDIDGLGCLYKVEGIGEDGLGYRYISGPKKATANKGKFYSGIPMKRLEELKTGKSYRYLPVSNFCDYAGSFGNCRLEGGVDFNGGKKPEALLEMLLRYYSNPGDLVLDSFLGSGTTAAVAHKMGRKYIGIEMGEHAYSHCKTRLDRIIAGSDGSGVTKSLSWQGGGGYRFYELAPSLMNQDAFGEYVINKEYDADMLAAAIALHEGFTYQPDSELFWKQSIGNENSYLFVTTRHMNSAFLDSIKDTMEEDEYLILVCRSFDAGLDKAYPNITIKKIPQMLLSRCEFGKTDYNLNIVRPPVIDAEEEEWDE